MEVVSTWARIFGKIIVFGQSEEDGERSPIQGGWKYTKKKDHGNESDARKTCLNGKVNE